MWNNLLSGLLGSVIGFFGGLLTWWLQICHERNLSHDNDIKHLLAEIDQTLYELNEAVTARPQDKSGQWLTLQIDPIYERSLNKLEPLVWRIVSGLPREQADSFREDWNNYRRMPPHKRVADFLAELTAAGSAESSDHVGIEMEKAKPDYEMKKWLCELEESAKKRLQRKLLTRLLP